MVLKHSSCVPVIEPRNLRLVIHLHCQLDVSNYVTITEIIPVSHKTSKLGGRFGL
jgi:hypothetical protein